MSIAQAPDHQRSVPPPSFSTSSAMDITNMLDRSRDPRPPPPSTSTATSASASTSTAPHPARPHMETAFPTQEPAPITTMDDGRIYSLDIVQQPVRARMCGFGDKDRRPITPPPCIRLVVKDAATGKEFDINDIDTSYYVLTVDLWSADASKEVNLVRHSSTSPSISAATSTSYPPPNEIPPVYAPSPLQQVQVSASGYGLPSTTLAPQQHNTYQPVPALYNQGHLPKQSELVYYQQAAQQQLQQQQAAQTQHHHHLPSSQPQTQSSLPPPPPTSQQMQNQGYYTAPPTPSTPTGQTVYYHQHTQPNQGPLPSPDQLPLTADPRTQPSGMFTRNLIGNLCVSAFKLSDDKDRMGVWFVLQDLSVRTEGTFRLKMNFVNVGQRASSSHSMTGKLNTASAPVLASIFSDKFDVFSAKKFPGVIESTELSKRFAAQGIKIPIRKDGARGNERRDDDDDE